MNDINDEKKQRKFILKIKDDIDAEVIKIAWPH